MGSDAGAVSTRAAKNGPVYLINGTKSWTTNGIESKGLVVFASTDKSKKNKGISSFLVKKDFPGKFDRIDLHAPGTSGDRGNLFRPKSNRTKSITLQFDRIVNTTKTYYFN